MELSLLRDFFLPLGQLGLAEHFLARLLQLLACIHEMVVLHDRWQWASTCAVWAVLATVIGSH